MLSIVISALADILIIYIKFPMRITTTMLKFVGNCKVFTVLLICLLTIHSGLSVDRKRRSTSIAPTHKSADSTEAGCQIPSNSSFEIFVKLHPSNTLNTITSSGSLVEDLDTIHLFCENGEENSEIPICSTYCNGDLLQGISTVYQCYRDGHLLEPSQCNRKILPNTEIEVKCADGYKSSGGDGRQMIRCLPNGMFDAKRQKCKADCGLIQPSFKPVTRNGIQMDPIYAPWHVAIYKLRDGQYLLNCGGSIISPSLIISAAHCYWNEFTSSTMPAENFKVMAAKYTRIYSTSTNELPQIREVETIQISQSYRGRADAFNADAAILKLKEPLIYNENISYVCLEFREPNDSDYVPSGTSGFLTKYDKNDTLEQVPMKTKSFQSCLEDPEVKELANDKFCVTNNEDVMIRRGDSGGGFVVKENGKKHRLLGIISNAPSEGVVALTNVRDLAPDLRDKIKTGIQNDSLLL